MLHTNRLTKMDNVNINVVLRITLAIGVMALMLYQRRSPSIQEERADSIQDTNIFPRTKRQVKREGSLIVMVSVNTKAAIRSVDERFVSVGATIGSINRTLGRTFNSTRFQTVARGLAPAIYRLGGAEADFTFFNKSPLVDDGHDSDADFKQHNLGRLNFNNLTLHGNVWDDLNEFARIVGWEMLFCLNALRRNGTAWDPTNAIELLDYTERKGHNVLWSLGNEPNSYIRKANVTITPEQMADSFRTLRNISNTNPFFRGAFVAGPDTSAPKKGGVEARSAGDYLRQFIQSAGNTTNVTSFHYYYMSGRTVSLLNYTDPHVADLLRPNIEYIRDSLLEYGKENSKIWISESGVTFGGGTVGINENYVTGILLLDKLGVSARYGADLVVQQNLAGAEGGLLDATFYPRLPYWLLLYHKRLMGVRVLNVSRDILSTTKNSTSDRGDNFNFTNYVRVYAHCTKTSALYSPGAVTLMIINMVPIGEVHISVEGALQNSSVHEYLFLPLGKRGILSRRVGINGQTLQMFDDLTLPYHSPRKLAPRSTIVVPPQTYGFYVLPEASAPACL